jgi:S-adenosyl-L-methionine hydrolase (adenosine-forming)
MPTIALLTDFGERDGFVAMLKGMILRTSPGCAIIDISHQVASFDIKPAAFILQKSFKYFPEGTVFVAVIDPGVGSNRRIIAADVGGYRFVAPDNGVLSYLLAGFDDRRVVSVENSFYFPGEVSLTFHGRDIMAPVAAHLANGVPLEDLGPLIDSYRVLPTLNLLKYRRGVMGEIVYVDKFGNLISNIAPSDLPADVEISQLHCIFGDAKSIKFADYYGAGEGLSAIISGFGTVELFVRQGSAAARYEQAVGATIAVEA